MAQQKCSHMMRLKICKLAGGECSFDAGKTLHNADAEYSVCMTPSQAHQHLQSTFAVKHTPP
jgi:hypothetical protein